MTKIDKKAKLVFFLGLAYSFLITLVALFLLFIGGGILPYAAKELVFVASEVLSLAGIFAFFIEIFMRRFER
jgi:predicted tellurium resistance membrane protein TerC